MKLKNLFWFATGASISYHLVKNRKEIKTEVTESSQLVMGIQDNLAKSNAIWILSKTKRPIFKNW